MADYLKSILGIFDNADEIAKEKARQAAEAARQAKQFVTQIPQKIQTASEKFIPGGISGGVQRVKQNATPENLFVMSPKNFRWAGQTVTDATSQSTNPLVRSGGSAFNELVQGKARGGSNIATGVSQVATAPGWWNKFKGAANVVKGAAQFVAPDVAIATGPARAVVSAGLGAGINALAAKIGGKDVATAAGEGATKGLRMAAITKFTDPAIAKIVGTVAPEAGLLARQAATRLITGVGNVAEDEIIAKMEEQKPQTSDRALSLAVGMALGGNDELFDLAKTKVKQLIGESTDPGTVARATKKVVDQIRDEKGRFSNTPAEPAPVVSWAKNPENPEQWLRTENGNFKPSETPPVGRANLVQDPTTPNKLVRPGSSSWAEMQQRIRTAQPQQAMGVMAGIETYQDENGQTKVKFDPAKAAAGLALTAGFTSTKAHLSDFEDVLTKTDSAEEAAKVISDMTDFKLNDLIEKIKTGDTEAINNLKGVRAALNKVMYKVADVDPAAGKYQKAVFETMKQDPTTAPLFDILERKIADIDQVIQTGGKDFQVNINEPPMKVDIQPTDVNKPAIPATTAGTELPQSQIDTPAPAPRIRKTAQQIQEEVISPKSPSTQTPTEPVVPTTDTSLTPSISRKQTPASDINVNRLDLTDEQKGRVTASQIKEVRDVLSDKEIQQIARDAGIDTKTNTIDQTAEKIATQLNVRRQVVELENQRTELLKNGATPEELEAVTRQIGDISKISREQGTDIARQLSARRIIANEINTPMQRVFQLLDKAGVNYDTYIKDASKIDFNDGNQVMDFYRKYVPANQDDWLTLLRYNSMLSSPNTFINNFAGNVEGSLAIKPIHMEVTAGVDALRSTLTGKPRQYASGEGVAYAKGYVQSVGKAVTAFGDVMKGKALSKNLDFRQVPLSEAGSKLRKVEDALKFPMSLLEATDQFFTTLTKGGMDEALAKRSSAGISVPDAAGTAESEAQAVLFRGDLGDNQGSTMLNALDTIANTIQKFKTSKNPIIANIAKFSLPFVKTPTNILKQGVEYSPAGILTLHGAKNKTEQVAKIIMGTSVAVGSAILLESDRITWAEPVNQKQKNAFRAAGMQPYAIKIGDKWVSYQKLHPAIAFPLALTAAIKDAQVNKNLDDTQVDQILAGAAKWVQFFADQSYVKSIGDLVAATKGDIESPTRLVGNYANQLIPFRALQGWIARIVDPYQRQVDSTGSALQKQFDYVKTQIPLLSMTVPAREDNQGNPVVNQNKWWNAFSPNKVTTEQPAAKQEYNFLKEKSLLDKENRQMKEKFQKEADTITTVPKANAAESPNIEGTGLIKDTTVQSGPVKVLSKNEKTRVKTLLDYGKPVPEEDLVAYYLNDVKGSSTDAGYKKTMRQKALLDKYQKVSEDETLSEAQKSVVEQAIMSEAGLNDADAEYYQTAKLSTELRYQKAQEDIAGFTDRKQIIQYLKDNRKTIQGDMVADSGLIDKFYEDGMITKEEAKALKALKYDEATKKFKMDRDYKATGGATTAEKKALLKAIHTPAKLSKAPTVGAGKSSWSNPLTGKSFFNIADTKVNTKIPEYKAPTMQQFFKQTPTAISSGKAMDAVNAVRGGGRSTDRLTLRYAGGR